MKGLTWKYIWKLSPRLSKRSGSLSNAPWLELYSREIGSPWLPVTSGNNTILLPGRPEAPVLYCLVRSLCLCMISQFVKGRTAQCLWTVDNVRASWGVGSRRLRINEKWVHEKSPPKWKWIALEVYNGVQWHFLFKSSVPQDYICWRPWKSNLESRGKRVQGCLQKEDIKHSTNIVQILGSGPLSRFLIAKQRDRPVKPHYN